MIKQIKNLTLILLLISLATGLAACGFKLRNARDLPPGLQTMYLQEEEPYGRFASTLQATLRAAGVNLLNSPSSAITLHLTKPNLAYNAATIGTSNQSRVYNVVLSVTFSLTNPQGDVLVAPANLKTTRFLTLNANQLIESNNQLSLLEQDMQHDLISQLFNRLSSPAVAQAIQNPPSAPPVP